MLSELQKQAAQAIVNIFETGRPRGEYGQVTVLARDTGHLTYGRAQTTLASGNLHLLIDGYCATDGAVMADALRPYLNRLDRRDSTLDDDAALHGLLRQAGDDPVMQSVQDGFFDRIYWAPALKSAAYINAELALGTAIVYDSRIHGSWHRIRDRTIEQHGDLDAVGERAWLGHYVDVRRNWLATHPNSILHGTVYRMDSFRELMAEETWDLGLPFVVRGLRIDEETLTSSEPVRPSSESLRVWAGDPQERVLKLRTPHMEGTDVSALQRALGTAGLDVQIDGFFGPGIEAAVRDFQTQEGLVVDGIVGAATLGALRP